MNLPRRALVALLLLGLTLAGLVATPAHARVETVTNLAHLDFLLDEVSPDAVAGHTTYRLEQEPDLVMPWTYADRQADGSYRRIGGGTYDPATGDYGQGAYNTDDITRTAVVYLRHWTATGDRGQPDEGVRAAALGGLHADGLRAPTPAARCCGSRPTAS